MIEIGPLTLDPADPAGLLALIVAAAFVVLLVLMARNHG